MSAKVTDGPARLSDMYLSILAERLKGGKDERCITLSISCPRWMKEDFMLICYMLDTTPSAAVLDRVIKPMLKEAPPELLFKRLQARQNELQLQLEDLGHIVQEAGSLATKKGREYILEQVYKYNLAYTAGDIEPDDKNSIESLITPGRIREILDQAVHIHGITYRLALDTIRERVGRFNDGLFKTAWLEGLRIVQDELQEAGELQDQEAQEPAGLDREARQVLEAQPVKQEPREPVKVVKKKARKLERGQELQEGPDAAQSRQQDEDELRLIKGLAARGNSLTAKGRERVQELEARLASQRDPEAERIRADPGSSEQGQGQVDPVQAALQAAGDLELKDHKQGQHLKGRPGHGRRKKV